MCDGIKSNVEVDAHLCGKCVNYCFLRMRRIIGTSLWVTVTTAGREWSNNMRAEKSMCVHGQGVMAELSPCLHDCCPLVLVSANFLSSLLFT